MSEMSAKLQLAASIFGWMVVNLTAMVPSLVNCSTTCEWKESWHQRKNAKVRTLETRVQNQCRGQIELGF